MTKDKVTRRTALGGIVGAATAPHVAAARPVGDMADGQRIFVDLPLADAEATTTEGQFFRIVDNATGEVTIYRRTATGSDQLYQELTSSALKSHQPDKGATFLGVKQPFSGAHGRNQSEKNREHVSLGDFVPRTLFTDLMNGEHNGDISAHINSALDSGESIVNPFRLACIAEPIIIKYDGQSMVGRGANTELRWLATDSTLNMIELQSTRRATGSRGTTRTNLIFADMMLSSAAGSAVKNAIWVESGVFHSQVERLRLLNFFGSVEESFIKSDSGGGTSYTNNLCLRDIVMTGVSAGSGSGGAVPRAVFMESAIEFLIERVKVFNVSDAFVVGTNDSENFRQIGTGEFNLVHAEIGNRRGAKNNACACRIYAGENLSFYSPKFNVGINDGDGFGPVDDQTCVEFMPHSGANGPRNVSFYSGRFWQVSPQQREMIYFNADSDADCILFESPRVVANSRTSGFIGLAEGVDAGIEVRNPDYDGLSKPTFLADLRGRRSVSHKPGFIATGGVETFDAGADNGHAYSTPTQASCSLSLQGLHLSYYKTSTTGVAKFRLWNPTGQRVELSDARFHVRHFPPDEIAGTVQKLWNPPAIEGAGITTRVPCPGARLGDFVKAEFAIRASRGMENAMLSAWVSADNLISVRLFNPWPNRNFAEDLLTVHRLSPVFDYIASEPHTILPLTGYTSMLSKTASVIGAAIGDFVEVSFSLDTQGVFLWGEVTEPGTVTLHGYNANAATAPEVPLEGVMTVGVRKRHMRL